MKEITSKDNKLIKDLSNLKNPIKFKKSQYFLVEGIKIIKEALNNDFNLKYLFVKNDKDIKDLLSIIEEKNGTGSKENRVEIISVSSDIYKLLSDKEHSEEPIAYFFKKENKSQLKSIKKAIILDNIQDPTNTGAIIRSAVAFGFKDVIITTGTANVFSPKVIRASAGQVFKANFYFEEPESLKSFAEKNKVEIIGADMNGEDYLTFKANDDFFLLFSNEGQGLKKEFEGCRKITVKMKNEVESLNVSVSASLIMAKLSS